MICLLKQLTFQLERRQPALDAHLHDIAMAAGTELFHVRRFFRCRNSVCTHYYVDMVFYNIILRAYVLIELKTTKLTPEAAGQINMYLNYYASEVNDGDDNPPIGIILCTEKDSLTAEYALGGLSNNIFASRYVLYMPDKEQLVAQVEAVIGRLHDDKS